MTEPTKIDLGPQQKLLSDRPDVPVELATNFNDPITPGAAVNLSAAKTTVKTKDAGVGKLLAVACSGSISALVVLALFAAVPIMQTVIGWRYADQCPVNWRIPHYSFIAGVIGLVVIALAMLQAILAMAVAGQFQKERDSTGVLVGATAGLCGISIVVIFLVIFLAGWFIAGCFWVFGAWSNVQYHDPQESDYCHPTAYRFTYYLLIISIVYYLYSCCRSSSQTAAGQKNIKLSKNSTPGATIGTRVAGSSV